jgi:hypothetical protein
LFLHQSFFSLSSTIFGGSSVTSSFSNHWFHKLNNIYFCGGGGGGGIFLIGSSFGRQFNSSDFISLSIS